MPSGKQRQRACTPEKPWCVTDPDAPQAWKKVVTPAFIARLAACGVACKGELATVMRDVNNCGLVGAIHEAVLWQRTHDVDSCWDASKAIFKGADPATIITDPPGNLAPKSKHF